MSEGKELVVLSYIGLSVEKDVLGGRVILHSRYSLLFPPRSKNVFYKDV